MKKNDISQQLIAFCKDSGVKFSVNERNLTLEQVFDPAGALPLLARSANEISMMCLDYGIGVTIETVEGTMFGLKASFDDTTPGALRLLFLVDIIQELRKSSASNGITALDCLLYD
jgi:hypothetical protein